MNPFPGLRPFEEDEDHLFFGRERQVDELIHRLRSTRLLAVVGASGMGKSSLVRCGLIPSLRSGLMGRIGSAWRVAVLRPGEDPIGALAAALAQSCALGVEGERETTNRLLLETTLRRGTGGLIDAVRMSRLPVGDNLLIVIDQFEELFRFRRSETGSRDEAALFVKLILEAAQENDLALYSVITMRSDFIGDCMQFVGLPAAVSAGQYLVPRLTRDELRLAISGPVAVAGGVIAPRLVTRLLNEVGIDPDQLPVLQHSLMRTWERAHAVGSVPCLLDIEHFEAVGGMRNALSLHAEEAYAETAAATSPALVAKIFKALTDTISDMRGIRRPTSIQDLAAICNASDTGIRQVVEAFRAPGRSFLMPPADAPLHASSVIDISHESLMRCWTRLADWNAEERVSAQTYIRIAQACGWFHEGSGGLWRDPELEVGLRWRAQNGPTAAWAQRYDSNFDRAIEFLERSAQERDRLRADQERTRKRKLHQAWSFAGALGALLIACALFAWFAATERDRAELNLNTAARSVDEMLASAGSQSGRVAAEVPEVQAFRRELLSKAEVFYSAFLKQEPRNESIQREMAIAHFRLGDIHRLEQEDPHEALRAIQEYDEAAQMFQALARKHPEQFADREREANSYNWLGETDRIAGKLAEAEGAYNAALAIQQRLHIDRPRNNTYTQELARTHYNRGILRYRERETEAAEQDYREAIALLSPLSSVSATYRQELDRAYNNRANLLSRLGRRPEAEMLYLRAITSHSGLVKAFSGNRDYQLELAEFAEDLAILYSETNRFDLAEQSWRQSEEQIKKLARRPPSLDLRLAKSRLIHGSILDAAGKSAQAADDYLQSVELLQGIAAGELGVATLEYHRTYGEALDRLAAFRWMKRRPSSILPLLANATAHNQAAGDNVAVAWDYFYLCRAQLDLGMMSDAKKSLENLRMLLPQIGAPDKDQILAKLGMIDRISPSEPAKNRATQ